MAGGTAVTGFVVTVWCEGSLTKQAKRRVELAIGHPVLLAGDGRTDLMSVLVQAIADLFVFDTAVLLIETS